MEFHVTNLQSILQFHKDQFLALHFSSCIVICDKDKTVKVKG